VAIETWQEAIGTLATVRGYPKILLRIKHIHQDIADPNGYSDLRPAYGGTMRAPAACVCELVSGNPPQSWETCTPYGHYRVSAFDLVLEGETTV
jgi:hypothetical protein